jgi:hypothetical protein
MLEITYSKGIFTMTDTVKTYTFNINNGHLINTKTNNRVAKPAFKKEDLFNALNNIYRENDFAPYANMLTVLYCRVRDYSMTDTFGCNVKTLTKWGILDKLFNVMAQFKIIGKTLSVEPYGSGHINVTYLAVTDQKRYILQKINHNLFKEVDKLMNNIYLVTEHLKKKCPDKTVLTLVKTIDDKPYLELNNEYYRVYDFIEESVCLQIPRNTFEDLIEHKFEDKTFFIPKNYDEFLTKRYGDYMQIPPESEVYECCQSIIECKL